MSFHQPFYGQKPDLGSMENKFSFDVDEIISDRLIKAETPRYDQSLLTEANPSLGPFEFVPPPRQDQVQAVGEDLRLKINMYDKIESNQTFCSLLRERLSRREELSGFDFRCEAKEGSVFFEGRAKVTPVSAPVSASVSAPASAPASAPVSFD